MESSSKPSIVQQINTKILKDIDNMIKYKTPEEIRNSEEYKYLLICNKVKEFKKLSCLSLLKRIFYVIKALYEKDLEPTITYKTKQDHRVRKTHLMTNLPQPPMFDYKKEEEKVFKSKEFDKFYNLSFWKKILFVLSKKNFCNVKRMLSCRCIT